MIVSAIHMLSHETTQLSFITNTSNAGTFAYQEIFYKITLGSSEPFAEWYSESDFLASNILWWQDFTHSGAQNGLAALASDQELVRKARDDTCEFVSMNGIRPSIDPAIIMRSPRSRRLSGSQDV